MGVWVSSESILLARSGKDNKAFTTSLYAIAVACGYVGGPLLAYGCSKLLPLTFAFILAGVIAICTSAYVLLRLAPDVRGELHEEHRTASVEKESSALGLLWRIKTSCFGTFAYGYFQASVVLFLPLYLMEQKGITEAETIVIPAYFAAGMLLFSNYAGRLGDRYGHLLLMRILGARRHDDDTRFRVSRLVPGDVRCRVRGGGDLGQHFTRELGTSRRGGAPARIRAQYLDLQRFLRSRDAARAVRFELLVRKPRRRSHALFASAALDAVRGVRLRFSQG